MRAFEVFPLAGILLVNERGDANRVLNYVFVPRGVSGKNSGHYLNDVQLRGKDIKMISKDRWALSDPVVHVTDEAYFRITRRMA